MSHTASRLHTGYATEWGSRFKAGGLLVAVTLKYADNILRNFAAGLAIIVAAGGSYFFFEFHLTPKFFGGVMLVICAIFIYGGSAQTPQELCPSLCGTGGRAADDARVGGDFDESDEESTPLRRSDHPKDYEGSSR